MNFNFNQKLRVSLRNIDGRQFEEFVNTIFSKKISLKFRYLVDIFVYHVYVNTNVLS